MPDVDVTVPGHPQRLLNHLRFERANAIYPPREVTQEPSYLQFQPITSVPTRLLLPLYPGINLAPNLPPGSHPPRRRCGPLLLLSSTSLSFFFYATIIIVGVASSLTIINVDVSPLAMVLQLDTRARGYYYFRLSGAISISTRKNHNLRESDPFFTIRDILESVGKTHGRWARPVGT